MPRTAHRLPSDADCRSTDCSARPSGRGRIPSRPTVPWTVAAARRHFRNWAGRARQRAVWRWRQERYLRHCRKGQRQTLAARKFETGWAERPNPGFPARAHKLRADVWFARGSRARSAPRSDQIVRRYSQRNRLRTCWRWAGGGIRPRTGFANFLLLAREERGDEGIVEPGAAAAARVDQRASDEQRFGDEHGQSRRRVEPGGVDLAGFDFRCGRVNQAAIGRSPKKPRNRSAVQPSRNRSRASTEWPAFSRASFWRALVPQPGF